MPESYKYSDNPTMNVAEPAVAYRRQELTIQESMFGNPNHPVHATQEEWWNHIHQIEQGKFYTAEEYEKTFDSWKQEYLAKCAMFV